MRFAAQTIQECIGLALRDWRLAEQLSQADAATRAGVSQSTWSRMEGGEVDIGLLVLVTADIDTGRLLVAARRVAVRDGVPWE